MTKALIIEDEKKAADLLEKMLWECDPAIEIVQKCNDLPTGVRNIKKFHPDIVFLDIELPVYSGLQLLDFFNEDEIDFDIIFTTASNQHAIHAFEMSAIDYLLKPLQEEKLKHAIQKFRQQVSAWPKNIPILKQHLQGDEIKKIVVPVLNGYDFLSLSDIYCLKAEGSYTKIFLRNKESLLVSKNLKYFEDILSPSVHFIRTHRSYIANIRFAKKITRSDGWFLILQDETEIPIIAEKIDEILKIVNL